MAQIGDTITYTFSDGTSVAEDVSNVGEVVVDYLYSMGGQGGEFADNPGSSGGAVENVVVNVSNVSTLYIWVSGTAFADGDTGKGRYNGGSSNTYNGGGSTEIASVNNNSNDSPTEPFIVAAGGGGGGFQSGFFSSIIGSGGARGGVGSNGSSNGEGDAPPVGGDASKNSSTAATPGDGAVSGHGSTVPIVETGSTTAGGGSSAQNDGEVKLSFKKSSLSPPDPPSNLTADVQ